MFQIPADYKITGHEKERKQKKEHTQRKVPVLNDFQCECLMSDEFITTV